MREQPVASQPSPSPAVRAGNRRRRVLQYIEAQGGELRAESGLELRRQICEGLGERAAPVSQALVALERAGLLERELDVERRRCHAIRLARPGGDGGFAGRHRSRPVGADQASDDQNDDDQNGETARERAQAELGAAERNLAEAIRRAAAASRRVQDLRRKLVAPAG